MQQHPTFTPGKPSSFLSGFFGVKANNKRWRATIDVATKHHHHLGTLDTKEEAALAHNRAARQALGKRYPNCESIEAAQAAAAAAAQASHSTATPPAKRQKTSHQGQGPGG
jgi:hypothetical protein